MDPEELINKLKLADKSTPVFTLEGDMKLCKVVDIYDGDTIKVVFMDNNRINKWNIRMEGYDSPEMRPSRKLENRDEIKKKAIEAKNYLKSLIMNENQLVYLKCGKFDKYGRLLGYVYIKEDDTESVNEMMIKNNHAYEYHGGTKKV